MKNYEIVDALLEFIDKLKELNFEDYRKSDKVIKELEELEERIEDENWEIIDKEIKELKKN